MTNQNTKELRHVSQMEWVDTNQPKATAYVIYKHDINEYNYKTLMAKEQDGAYEHNSLLMKMANILAVGGTIQMTDGKKNIECKLEDTELVEMFQLAQLEYLMSKYKKVTGFYAKLAWEYFTNRLDAIRFFKSEDWKNTKATRLNKMFALDALLPALAEFTQEKQIQIMSIQEQKRQALIWTQAAHRKVSIFKRDVDKDLPNQDVTTSIQPIIDVQVAYGESGPYLRKGKKYISTETDKIEAKVVNAWLYNQPEFRVQTLDEKLEELQELRTWFNDYSNMVRQGRQHIDAESIAKYDRLEQLEFEVGLALDSVSLEATILK